MGRTVRVVLALGGLMLGMGMARTASAEAAKCTIATKGDSEVAKACADGGIPKAKAVMKDMGKRAKAAGMKTQCDDCHSDTETTFKLTKDGRKQFEKMVALLAKK